MKSLLTTVTFLVTAVGGASSCLADEIPAEVPSRVVHFSDVDLRSPAGAAVLYERIRQAARAVCEAHGPGDLSSLARFHRCIAEATARAIVDVNAPALTRQYSAQTRTAAELPRKAELIH
jgi:UrcA family protein